MVSKDDAISRSDLQKQFDDKCIKDCAFCPFYVWIMDDSDDEGGYCGLIRKAPALDVAPVVHAKWILEESPYAEHEEAYDGESHDRYVCSKCGHEAGYMCDPDGFADGQDLTPWCGECGALMDGAVL